MQLRDCTIGDAGKIAALENAVFTDPWTERMWRDECERQDFFGLVLEENGALLGYACATVLFEDAELLRIAVAEQVRSKGLGGKLMDALITAVKARGATQMFLEVRATNASALGLYNSRGFEKTRVRGKYYADGEDAVEMKKTL